MKNNVKFITIVSYSHFLAYFFAGIFALAVADYENLFATPEMALLMRQFGDPMIMLGPVLQIFRGVLIALILLPIKDVILDGKHGFLKLGILILGLSFLSTIGPTPGSFDGFIYTIIPVKSQLLGYPEAIFYILLFCSLIWISYKIDQKWLYIIFILFTIIISCLLLSGYANTIS